MKEYRIHLIATGWIDVEAESDEAVEKIVRCIEIASLTMNGSNLVVTTAVKDTYDESQDVQ